MQESFEDGYDTEVIMSLDADFISVECLEKLGLAENPFIDHARDPFLFIDQQLEMSVNVLVDYLQKQNSTLVLLGEIGIGKTTHLRVLLRRGYQHFNFCTLRAKPNTSFSEIEKKIQERWRLPVQELDESIQSDEYIKRYIASDKSPVLIIDDAHRLQNQVLDSLLQLKHRVGLQSPKALGLVLASEPKIQTQLSELEQTNPAATQIYQINARAFDATQSEKYIKYRLKKAGATDTNLLEPKQLQSIHSRSKGLPRVINTLAREALAQQCQNESHDATPANNFTLTPGLRLALILVGLIGLAFIIGALLKNPSENIELELSKDEVKLESTQPESIDIEPAELPTNVVEQVSATIKPLDIPKPYVAPLVLGPLQMEKQTENKVPTVEKETVEQQEETTTQVDQTQPFAQDWLLQQKPEAYTVQIVASPSQENLFAFAKKNLAGKQTAYYQKIGQDKQWFVLFYGLFPTRAEALTAIENLPPDIKKNQPYPLQIKQIQQVVRQP